MCQNCGPDHLEFESNKPGCEEDMPFTADEFVNACRLARDGPFEDDNDNWTRLVRMYNRIVTLRIDVVQYCEDIFPENLIGSPVYLRFLEADQAHRDRAPLPFGLPFSAEEFLAILGEFTDAQLAKYYHSLHIHEGTRRLFVNMVFDLAHHDINLQEFLADHVPAKLEKNPILLRLLAAAQGEHTPDLVVDFDRFMLSVFASDGRGLDGRLVGPLTHFQAAMFVQTLAEVTGIPDEHRQAVAEPHGRCNVDVANVKFVLSPCCNVIYSRCCIMTTLIRDGPTCPTCREHLIEVRKVQVHQEATPSSYVLHILM